MTLTDLKFERGKHYGKSLSEVLTLDYPYLRFMSSLSNRRASSINTAIDDIVKFVEVNMLSQREVFKNMYVPIVQCLRYFQIKRKLKYLKDASSYVDAMIEKLESGFVFSGDSAGTLCYVAAKAKGRGNSKIHKETCNNFRDILNSVQELEKITLENIKKSIKFE
jgi:hypothetical protein